VLTFDKDFGELAFCFNLPVSCGIVLFRIPLLSVDYVTDIIIEVIESRSDWAGHFSVVEPGPYIPHFEDLNSIFLLLSI
jgi:hypothetical protein